MKAVLKVALVPLTSTDKVDVNVQKILNKLNYIKSNIDIVFLPENSLYFNFNKKLDPSHAILDDESLQPLKDWAKNRKAMIHLGGVPYKTAHGICNSSLVIDETGFLKSHYEKIHLFDVDVAGKTVRESDSFTPGKIPAILEVKGWKIGLSICYDLRFAELFVHYHKLGVDAIVVPSSFLVETGRAHWSTLLRARAIETQSYVLAPAQVGIHESGRDKNLAAKTTWGESLAIGPWGEILARSESFDDKVGVGAPIVLDLEPSKLDQVRGQIPMKGHRKL
jgi:deaminated glutathione amidase